VVEKEKTGIKAPVKLNMLSSESGGKIITTTREEEESPVRGERRKVKAKKIQIRTQAFSRGRIKSGQPIPERGT